MVDSTTPMNRVGTTESHGPSEARSIGLHALAAAVMYVSPLLLFVPAAYMSAGLRHGRRGLIGAIGGSALVLGVLSLATGPGGIAVRDVSGLLRLVVTVGLPSAWAVFMIRRGARLGLILVGALAIGFLGFLGLEGTMRVVKGYSPYAGIVSEFDVASKPTMEIYRQAGIDSDTLGMMERFSKALVSRFVPSVLAVITALMFLFSLIMLPRLPWTRETAPALLFRGFAMPDWVAVIFVIAGLSPLVRGGPRTAGLNLLVVVGFLYLVQGLAVFRAIVLRLRLRAMGNVVAYGLLGLMMLNGIAPVLLFAVGLFDTFFDFRNYKPKGDSDESDSD